MERTPELAMQAVIGVAPPLLNVSGRDECGRQGTGADGILGLGPSSHEVRLGDDTTITSSRNLIQQLYCQRLLKSDVFALRMRGQDHNGPSILAGEAEDSAEQNDDVGYLVLEPEIHLSNARIAWCPLQPPDALHGDRWTIPLNAVRVNSVTEFHAQIALIDSGTSFIVTSRANLKALQRAMPESRVLEGRHEDMLIVHTSTVPQFELQFPGKGFMLNLDDIRIGKEYEGEFVVGIVGVHGLEEDLWILGCIFLQYVTAHFDVRARRIGFEHHESFHKQ
jgi:hypothetical protein